MRILGIYSSTRNQRRTTTLFVSSDFSPYHNDAANGRSCTGQMTEAIYVGDYDCSTLKIGTEIDINYDKAISTSRGTYQPIKSIVAINK